jgi:hypothetical protein
MQIRRPIAALMTALALFGGGATLTACGDPAGGADRNDGTTDDAGHQGDEGTDNTTQENDEDNGNLPNNTDPENESEDGSDDRQDPD